MVFLETNVLLFVFSKGYDFSKISRGLLLLAGKALFAVQNSLSFGGGGRWGSLLFRSELFALDDVSATFHSFFYDP